MQNTQAPLTSSTVLGKNVMEAVWADMALTELPSWVMDVPPNYRGSNLIRFMGYRWVMGQNKSILTADRTTFYPRKHFNVTD